MLAVIETHPVQYHAPVYRALQRDHGIPVTAIYGCPRGAAGYRDAEFGSSFKWDVDLLGGYSHLFLSAGGRIPGFSAVPAIRARLAELRPSAVLLTGYSGPFHAAAFAALGNFRALFRAETNDGAVRRSPLKTVLRDAVLRRWYPRFDALLYVGSRSREHYERLGFRSKLFFSPYCVDDTPFRAEESDRTAMRDACRAAHGFAPEDRVVLFSGKLVERKGVRLLPEAARALSGPLRSRAAFLFLGDGALKGEIADACAAAGVRAAFAGFRNQTELSPYYHAADALALPSVSGETWGLVVNEALRHGVRCVVSGSVGCAADLVEPGRTGETFRSGDAAALAAALARVLGSEADADTRRACRAKAEAYSVARAAAGIAEAFRAGEGL